MNHNNNTYHGRSSSPPQARELCNLLNCFLSHPIYNDSTLLLNENSQKKNNTSTTSNKPYHYQQQV